MQMPPEKLICSECGCNVSKIYYIVGKETLCYKCYNTCYKCKKYKELLMKLKNTIDEFLKCDD
jgi:hypothetical protein